MYQRGPVSARTYNGPDGKPHPGFESPNNPSAPRSQRRCKCRRCGITSGEPELLKHARGCYEGFELADRDHVPAAAKAWKLKCQYCGESLTQPHLREHRKKCQQPVVGDDDPSSSSSNSDDTSSSGANGAGNNFSDGEPSLTTAKDQGLAGADVAKHISLIAYKLKLYSQLGYIFESMCEAQVADECRIRAVENAPLDAVEVGPTILIPPSENTLDKQAYLGSLSHRDVEDSLRLIDWKLFSLRIFGSGDLSLYRPAIKKDQSENASQLELIWPMSLSTLTVLPVGNRGPFGQWQVLDNANVPIPFRLAGLSVPGEYGDELRRSIRDAIQNAEDFFFVPWNSIKVPIGGFDPRFSSDRELVLAKSGSSSDVRVVGFIRNSVKRSAFAQEREINVDISITQPYGGDCRLLETGKKDKRIELKERRLGTDGNGNIIYKQVWKSKKGSDPSSARSLRRRISPFHPTRVHHYLVLLEGGKGDKYSTVWWIPCSEFEEEYWTAEEDVLIPESRWEQYKITNLGQDWIHKAYAIMDQFEDGLPERKPYNVDLATTASDYAAARHIDGVPEVEEEPENPVPQSFRQQNRLKSQDELETLKMMFAKLNASCRAHRRGAVLETGMRKNAGTGESSFPQAVLVPDIEWSKEDCQIYDNGRGTLPVSLNTSSLEPHTLVIPLCFLTARMQFEYRPALRIRTLSGHPNHVPVLELDQSLDMPFVGIVGWYGASESCTLQSCGLVASELFETKPLMDELSKLTSTSIRSWQDFNAHLVSIKGTDARHKLLLGHKAAELGNLNTILGDLSLGDLQVREGNDLLNSLFQIADADDGDTEKFELDYGSGLKIPLKCQYLVPLNQLMELVIQHESRRWCGTSGNEESDDSDDDEEVDGDDGPEKSGAKKAAAAKKAGPRTKAKETATEKNGSKAATKKTGTKNAAKKAPGRTVSTKSVATRKGAGKKSKYDDEDEEMEDLGDDEEEEEDGVDDEEDELDEDELDEDELDEDELDEDDWEGEESGDSGGEGDPGQAARGAGGNTRVGNENLRRSTRAARTSRNMANMVDWKDILSDDYEE